ncbi:hypothetical protein BKG70_19980 [Mycobacteroides chelonae]|nr:hypothetical protein BKG66_21275 [Mycobacteroides chelonae]OHT68907.1 hypothetical protein BKG67_19825 [Mycobacteroides chelonae]OHT83817.1 hypothetical protein BKG70_19980 [Mycobacteroides chelonae]
MAKLTEASWRAESIPDDPQLRLRSVVVHEEIASGRAYCGGIAADQLVALVLVEFTASDGVLDPVRRNRFAADLEESARQTASGLEGRRLITSVIFNEVVEGRWGRGGKIVRLPEMAAAAGFEHLTAIAER